MFGLEFLIAPLDVREYGGYLPLTEPCVEESGIIEGSPDVIEGAFHLPCAEQFLGQAAQGCVVFRSGLQVSNR